MRTSTCAYSTDASKFVTNYRVDKGKFGSLGVAAFLLQYWCSPIFGAVAGEASEYYVITVFFYFLLQHSLNSLFRQKYTSHFFSFSSAFPCFPFQFYKFPFSKFISTSCNLFCSITISVSAGTFSVGKKKQKINQNYFLSFLVGIEIT